MRLAASGELRRSLDECVAGPMVARPTPRTLLRRSARRPTLGSCPLLLLLLLLLACCCGGVGGQSASSATLSRAVLGKRQKKQEQQQAQKEAKNKGSGKTGSAVLGGRSAVSLLSNVDLSTWPKREVLDKDGSINQVVVIGERHHGTNYMQTSLEKNLKVKVMNEFCAFKHKYQAPHYPGCKGLDLSHVLVVVMLRNPYDWAASMHGYCWCGTPEDKPRFQKKTVRDFMTEEDFPENSGRPWLGEPLDKRIATCGNLMTCRALKYANFINISSWAPHVEYVRYEDVMSTDQMQAWVDDVAGRFRIPAKRDGLFKAVTTYKGWGKDSVNVTAKQLASTWFNPARLEADGKEARSERRRAQLVMQTYDEQMERLVGYGPLPNAEALVRDVE